MKKKATRKDFYMEIKKSPGRFISIFFIVAMGSRRSFPVSDLQSHRCVRQEILTMTDQILWISRWSVRWESRMMI